MKKAPDSPKRVCPALLPEKTYDTEYKVQAVKLGREIGFSKAARELNVNADREVW